MSSPVNPTPLNLRGTGPALMDVHIVGAQGVVVVGGFHLPGSGIRTNNLLVSGPTLLNARLPASVIIKCHQRSLHLERDIHLQGVSPVTLTPKQPDLSPCPTSPRHILI